MIHGNWNVGGLKEFLSRKIQIPTFANLARWLRSYREHHRYNVVESNLPTSFSPEH